MNFITLTPGKSANFIFEGYFYDKTFFVYLSSTNNSSISSVTSVNLFADNAKLSACFPPFSGYEITSYAVNSNNFIEITVGNFPVLSSTYDIIIGNNAGYSLLSNKNYLINYTSIAPSSGNALLLQGGGYMLLQTGFKYLLNN